MQTSQPNIRYLRILYRIISYKKRQRKCNVKFIRQSLSLFPSCPSSPLFHHSNRRASLYADSWRWSFPSSSARLLPVHNRQTNRWSAFACTTSSIVLNIVARASATNGHAHIATYPNEWSHNLITINLYPLLFLSTMQYRILLLFVCFFPPIFLLYLPPSLSPFVFSSRFTLCSALVCNAQHISKY